MALEWLCLVAFVVYFVGYETYWGLTKYKKILWEIGEGKRQRTSLYVRLMAGLWIPAGIVFILLATGQVDLSRIGLSWLQPHANPWLTYASAALASVYFLYLAYSLVVLRINAIRKINLAQKIPDEIKLLLPVTRPEKLTWAFTAITAGITEELLFRGFFFYLLGSLFPTIPLLVVLLVSTLIFGIGHLYQGVGEAVKPAILGFVFGVFYIAFGSIIPSIVLHAMQDLCVVDIVNE